MPARDRPERTFRINRRRPRGAERVLVFVLIAIVASALLFVNARELLPKLVQAVRRDPATWLLGGVALLSTPVFMWAERRWSERARLFVGPDGLRLESALPRWLQLGGAMRDWQLRWDEIASIAVAERFGFLHLRKRGRLTQRLVLRVTDWIEESPGGEVEPVRTDAGLKSTALWQELAARGLFEQQRDDAALATMNFDLVQHPATRAALIVLAGLAAYAAADALMANETWADYSAAYYLPHVVMGVAAGVLAGWTLMRSAPPAPNPVALSLGMLMALAVGTASYFALIRINQVVGGPLESRAYVRDAACAALVPVEAGLPPIEYAELAKGYWCQFPIEQRHQVLIRRGLFGLYQVDLTQHTAAIRAFRRGERPAKP